MALTAVGRLRRRPDFLQVADARRKFAAAGLVLQARRRRSDVPGVAPDAVRVGFTVTRKVGNAVTRNRARRRLKAAARDVLAQEAAPGHDLVVVGRAGTLTRPFALLVEDLRTAMARLGVRRAPAVTEARP